MSTSSPDGAKPPAPALGALPPLPTLDVPPFEAPPSVLDVPALPPLTPPLTPALPPVPALGVEFPALPPVAAPPAGLPPLPPECAGLPALPATPVAPAAPASPRGSLVVPQAPAKATDKPANSPEKTRFRGVISHVQQYASERVTPSDKFGSPWAWAS